MKCIFKYNGRIYLAPSRIQAKKFIKYWFGWDRFVFDHRRGNNGLARLRTTWKLKTVERAPDYAAAFFVMDKNGVVEYMQNNNDENDS